MDALAVRDSEHRNSKGSSTLRRLVIAGTFTIDPVLEPVQFWIRELDLPYAVRVAPYGQIVQSLLNPESDLRSKADVGALVVRLEDWSKTSVSAASLESNAQLFLDACGTFRKVTRRPLTIWLCPNSRASASDGDLSKALADVERTLIGRCQEIGIRVVTADEIFEKYSVPEVEDSYLLAQAHIPYTEDVFTALGTMIVRELAARERRPLKCVVLDADNTLWRGICGEDGPDGVVIDAAALGLQRFFLKMRSQGIVLSLCTKNAEADVRSVFARQAVMPLRWEHFSVHKVNWQAKSRNIREIATALNIGLDAIAFVDDNPVECAEVQMQCPEVLVCQLPEDPQKTTELLHAVWEFDHLPTSDEHTGARLRTYELNRAREELRAAHDDLDSFLRALQVRVGIRELRSADLERAADLTQRTNQFNVSQRRRTVGELEALWRTGALHALVVEVGDRFGEYGLTGLVLFEVERERLRVDTLLLSCRVLGKKVEDEVLLDLEQRAQQLGCRQIEVPYIESPRNQPAGDFLLRWFGDGHLSKQAGTRYVKDLV